MPYKLLDKEVYLLDLTALVAGTQFDGGLLHDDGLEPPLQSGVLLNVLAVLVEGGGPDDLELPPAEGGL